MLYFFLSYARGDDDTFVDQFYRDLSGEVRLRAGLHRDTEVGFVDTHSIEMGATWTSRLVTALTDCRVFIALLSPRYFLSEACGKEWSVFADRMQRHEQVTGERPSALMPVIWLPPRRIPPVASAIQYHVDRFGDVYRKDGLRQLMRLQRNLDAYLSFVSELADVIVSAADAEPLPHPHGQDFDNVPNAFHAPPRAEASHPAEPPPPAAEPVEAPNPHYVHFVVAAPTRHEMEPVRSHLEFYGDSAIDWAPYHPSLRSPLADFARTIAAKRNLSSGVAEVDGLIARMESAARDNQIVVLLVDPWATRLNDHRRALTEYNQRDTPNAQTTTAVMIPGSHDDAETREHWRQLTDSLRSIFLNRVVGGDDVMYRSSILTHGAFDEDLQVVLEVARNRIFVKGNVYRRPPDPGSDRPILEGP